MARRQNHHLVPKRDTIANGNRGAQIEEAADIYQAAAAERQPRVQIAIAGNTRHPPHHAAMADPEASRTQRVYSQAATDVARQQGAAHLRKQEPGMQAACLFASDVE